MAIYDKRRFIIQIVSNGAVGEYIKHISYAKNKLGGTHHGYFLPHEGANNIAYALFTFPSLAAYEEYRVKMALDEECQAAIKFAEDNKCILSYERSFMRPIF